MRQQLEFMLQALRECLIAGPRYTWDLIKKCRPLPKGDLHQVCLNCQPT